MFLVSRIVNVILKIVVTSGLQLNSLYLRYLKKTKKALSGVICGRLRSPFK